MKDTKNKYILCGIIASAITFLTGFCMLFFMYKIMNPSNDLPGLFYYKAATYGDAIGLTILIGSLVAFAKKNGDFITKKKYSIIMAIICGCIGIAIQASWIISDSTVLNWTIPKQHFFNIAGWWHAVFFVGIFAALGYYLTCVRVITKKMSNYSFEDKILIVFIITSGTIYMLCHIADDYSNLISMGLSYGIVALLMMIIMCSLLISKNIKFANIKKLIFYSLISGIGIYHIIVTKNVSNIILSLSGAMSMVIYVESKDKNITQYIISCIPIVIGTFGILSYVSWCDIVAVQIGLGSVFFLLLLLLCFKGFPVKKIHIVGIIISLYAVLEPIIGKTIFDNYVSNLFVCSMALLFNTGIKNVFEDIIRAEVSLNNDEIENKEFKEIKGVSYIKIICMICSLALMICSWISFDKSDFYVDKKLVILFIIGFTMILLTGIKAAKNNFLSILSIMLLTFEYGVLLLICYYNTFKIDFSKLTVISICIMVFALFANIGCSMMLSHGFRMNVVTLRGIKKIPWQVNVISRLMGIGALLVSLNTTILLAADLSAKRLLISLCMVSVAYWLIPMMYAIIYRMDQNTSGAPVIPNTSLGGVAQDSLMIILIIFCLSFLPNMYCSTMSYQENNTINIIIKGCFLLKTAFTPVTYCLSNNAKHLVRQRKVAVKTNKMELWETLRKEILIQSKQACFTMLPYIMVVILFTQPESSDDDTITFKNKFKTFKSKYIEVDKYDE